MSIISKSTSRLALPQSLSLKAQVKRQLFPRAGGAATGGWSLVTIPHRRRSGHSAVELQTNLREDYAKFDNHREGPY